MRICPHGESAYLRRLGSTGAQKLLECSPLARFWIWLHRGKTAVWWRVFVLWLRCLYGNEWPEKATILTTGAFSKVVGRLTADAKRCRKNSDPAASKALLGSTFACPGEPSQSNKEASGQRDERPRALQNTLTMILFCQNLPLQSLWSKALCQAGLQQLWLETGEHH